MKRHWTHYLNVHIRCHPAHCRDAADLFNYIESESRISEWVNGDQEALVPHCDDPCGYLRLDDDPQKDSP